MKKIIFFIIFFQIFILAPNVSAAGESFAQKSAGLSFLTSAPADVRVYKLRKFFERYNSPLANHAGDFIFYADKYDIDWRLVPAISGVESTFGKRIPKNSYNAYGWAGGKYRFNSWEHSIEVVTKALREKYYDKGANTLTKINRIYCPPNPKWGNKVAFFMTKIDSIPIEFSI